MSATTRRLLALFLLAAGVGMAVWMYTGHSTAGRSGVKLVALTPLCVLLGVGGLLRPGLIGNDPHLSPEDRRLQLALVVAGMLCGGALVWADL